MSFPNGAFKHQELFLGSHDWATCCCLWLCFFDKYCARDDRPQLSMLLRCNLNTSYFGPWAQDTLQAPCLGKWHGRRSRILHNAKDEKTWVLFSSFSFACKICVKGRCHFSEEVFPFARKLFWHAFTKEHALSHLSNVHCTLCLHFSSTHKNDSRRCTNMEPFLALHFRSTCA